MFIIELTYKAPLEQIDAQMKPHMAFLNKHYASGHFLVSGRKIPRDGGIILAVEESRQEMAVLTNSFEGFGFSPLSWQQVNAFLWSIPGYTVMRNDQGVVLDSAGREIPSDCRGCQPAWRSQTGPEWWASRRGDIVTLVGWAIMVMLLSVGAPFWQDTLESLFGIKNLLRQKSATQNIETQSGAGQPKE